MRTPDDVLELMDSGAEGVVAYVEDAGATFLAPIFDELTAIVCPSGTLRSHIGIVSREFGVPCVMGCTLDALPDDGIDVTIDCSTSEATVAW
jgi:signal transduction protein with GAF and PtsI domain